MKYKKVLFLTFVEKNNVKKKVFDFLKHNGLVSILKYREVIHAQEVKYNNKF